MVGDIDVARRAVKALPHASHRQVALAEMMESGGKQKTIEELGQDPGATSTLEEG
jgi:hypothetical protein